VGIAVPVMVDSCVAKEGGCCVQDERAPFVGPTQLVVGFQQCDQAIRSGSLSLQNCSLYQSKQLS